MGSTESDWAHLKDEELLRMRICDLNLRIEGGELSVAVHQLFLELEAKRLTLRPKVYLGDEWFSPEGNLTISIPFFLAHPRLRELEHSQMLEVEGGTPDSLLKLLRHEMGHCFDHAFQFSRRPKWRKIFGSPAQEYQPEVYRPKPYSKSYVRHLDQWYAQAHPDEDFAETFAVWLGSKEEWKNQYHGWGVALKKLRYVDELAKSVESKNPKKEKFEQPYSASKSKMTLGTYYQRKKKEHAESYPDFYDQDLKEIFGENTSTDAPTAASMIKKNKAHLIKIASKWSGEGQYPVESLVKKLISRAEVLKLKSTKAEPEILAELSGFLSSIVTHNLLTGKYKRSSRP